MYHRSLIPRRLCLAICCASLLAGELPVYAAPPPPDYHDQRVTRRDLLTDLTNSLPDSVQGDVSQGILQNWWSGIPRDNAAIQKALGVDNLDSLNATTEFLNIP